MPLTDAEVAYLTSQRLGRLATVDKNSKSGVGEFATTAMHAHAMTSMPVGQAGVRAAALQTRRTAPKASSAPAVSFGELSTPEQIRAELLAIRALLVS